MIVKHPRGSTKASRPTRNTHPSYGPRQANRLVTAAALDDLFDDEQAQTMRLGCSRDSTFSGGRGRAALKIFEGFFGSWLALIRPQDNRLALSRPVTEIGRLRPHAVCVV